MCVISGYQAIPPQPWSPKMTTVLAITADFDLGLIHADDLSHPDTARLDFTPGLIALLARALAGIRAMDVGFGPEVRVSIGNLDLIDCGEPWEVDDDVSSSSQFKPSSFWLKVDERSISIEIWDKYGDAELRGDLPLAEIPGLVEALENAKADAYAALRARLA